MRKIPIAIVFLFCVIVFSLTACNFSKSTGNAYSVLVKWDGKTYQYADVQIDEKQKEKILGTLTNDNITTINCKECAPPFIQPGDNVYSVKNSSDEIAVKSGSINYLFKLK